MFHFPSFSRLFICRTIEGHYSLQEVNNCFWKLMTYGLIFFSRWCISIGRGKVNIRLIITNYKSEDLQNRSLNWWHQVNINSFPSPYFKNHNFLASLEPHVNWNQRKQFAHLITLSLTHSLACSLDHPFARSFHSGIPSLPSLPSFFFYEFNYFSSSQEETKRLPWFLSNSSLRSFPIWTSQKSRPYMSLMVSTMD